VLTNADIFELTDLRHDLHARPELSGEERKTAGLIKQALVPTKPDMLIEGLGGHGVAAVYAGSQPGPTVMFRCELDALPIEELTTLPYRSGVEGHGHLCGHDGHMAILSGLARLTGRQRPARGRAVLLFQPAEENGAGAAAVVADPRFAQIAPDYAFALHNMPGLPFGKAALQAGPVNCASRGLRIVLTGKTSHASQPEAGVSPATALARLIPALGALATGGTVDETFRLVTITHMRMGERAFGITPGQGELWATLRTLTDAAMASLLKEATALAESEAKAGGLVLEIAHHDVFNACHNDPEATRLLAIALDAEGIAHDATGLPYRASEDFGLFGRGAKSAMFFLGAGEDSPMLHNPDYDFPDRLIEPGVRIFNRVLRALLG
jgi:amidohydrolase